MERNKTNLYEAWIFKNWKSIHVALPFISKRCTEDETRKTTFYGVQFRFCGFPVGDIYSLDLKTKRKEVSFSCLKI